MKEKSASAVSIIGGADGPTSVFLAGRTGKRPLKIRIRNFLYKCKRKQVAKRIVPGAHSLEEVITYAKTKYSAIEIDTTQHNYIEQRKSLKESLIITHKPDLLGDMKDIPKPTDYTEESVREFYNHLESRRKMISQIPDEKCRWTSIYMKLLLMMDVWKWKSITNGTFSEFLIAEVKKS